MFEYPRQYDVIVVGAGHAGVEAAMACARIGCQTLMLTANPDTIGQMSCNPAIGGLGKGHLVREIDALGGVMGEITDYTGVQFRMLNTKKGASVRAPRAQCDKKAYQFRAKWLCEREPNLDIKQGQAAELLVNSAQIAGVRTTMGIRFSGRAVVLTTGTFLKGLMHVGENQTHGGRSGDIAANELSASLSKLGLSLGRLKTGTPPRLLKRSIDFSTMVEQRGDTPPPYFSHWNSDMFHVEQSVPGVGKTDYDQYFPFWPKPAAPTADSTFLLGSLTCRLGGQVPCYLTATTAQTADIIRRNLHRSPMYSGQIEGVGPRYCPSIEDKVVRFASKDQHQVFMEPEGIESDEIYVNGLSSSLPFDVQYELVRSIIGCRNAEILRPAYAVEYDYVDPTQVTHSLETKACRGLFLAGQINGTSGYEEAAAQGLIAGINAAQQIFGKVPFTLRRDQAYIGVMIDDLVTQGVREPYRMFTSRAEYRLSLRHDNADQRLSPVGRDLGLLSERKLKLFDRKQAQIRAEMDRLSNARINSQSLLDILRRPEIRHADLPPGNVPLSDDVVSFIESDVKYAGYVNRQAGAIEKLRSLEAKQLPVSLDYSQILNLRTEAREKLSRIRPSTLGQASRIAGVTPADVSSLAVWLKRGVGSQPIESDPATED